MTSAKRRAREKQLPFNITLEDIVIPEYCPILNIKLFLGKGNPCDNSPSLDRIIPEFGYVKGNVRVISCKANLIKNHGNMIEHEKVLFYMKNSMSGKYTIDFEI